MNDHITSSAGTSDEASAARARVIRIRTGAQSLVTPPWVEAGVRRPCPTGGIDPLHRIHSEARSFRSSHGRRQSTFELGWRLRSHPGVVRLPGAGSLLMEN